VSSRKGIILIGALAGAALGATAAWAYVQAQEKGPSAGGQRGGKLTLKAGVPELFKIGVALLTVMRQIAELVK
jgi:hypothetical protein